LSGSLHEQKIRQAGAILDEMGVDAWLTFVRETAAAGDPALPFLLDGGLTWESALILTRRGERIAIVGSLDAAAVERSGLWGEVIPYVEGIRAILRATLERLNLGSLAINYSRDDVQADGLAHGLYLVLLEHLEGLAIRERLASAEGIIRRLRGRKTPAEVERIRRATAAAEEIFALAGRSARPGMTEAALARLMKEEAARRGLETAWDPLQCPIVNTGPLSAAGHGVPSELRIEPGHLLHVDFGVRCDGYCSDLQRMWYVPRAGEREAPADAIRAFDALRGSIQKTAAALRPGLLGREGDAIARRAVAEAGFPDYAHGTGHNVGRATHDGGGGLLPLWERYGESPRWPIEAGNVLTIEPSIARVGERGCMGLEEMVLITESGCEFLSRPQGEIWLAGLQGR